MDFPETALLKLTTAWTILKRIPLETELCLCQSYVPKISNCLHESLYLYQLMPGYRLVLKPYCLNRRSCSYIDFDTCVCLETR